MLLWGVLSLFYNIILDHRILDDTILGDGKKLKGSQVLTHSSVVTEARNPAFLLFSKLRKQHSQVMAPFQVLSFQFSLEINTRRNILIWPRGRGIKSLLSRPHSFYCTLRSSHLSHSGGGWKPAQLVWSCGWGPADNYESKIMSGTLFPHKTSFCCIHKQ